MRFCFFIFLLATAMSAMPASAQEIANRFRGMDRDADGVITRSEWRGSTRSFSRHDWNADGVLSGDEIRAGSWPSQDEDEEFDQSSAGELNDWTEQRFRELDHNSDARLSRSEWHFDAETFRRIDRDRDGTVSRREFLGLDIADDDRGDRFEDLDVNNDARVTRQEWHASGDAFRWLDRDGDGVLSRMEVVGPGEEEDRSPDWFRNLDVDRNQRVTTDEWHWSRAGFQRRDRNGDGAITRDELGGSSDIDTRTVRSEAYQQGYERGMADGRKAGREDKQLRNQWDLDGQRELEQADAGYRQGIGSRTDYQTGYREAFRIGYREGFGPR
jgi:Ca2+-binding EF-hand superfamily protein